MQKKTSNVGPSLMRKLIKIKLNTRIYKSVKFNDFILGIFTSTDQHFQQYDNNNNTKNTT